MRVLVMAVSLLWMSILSALAAPHLSYIYPAGGQRGTTVKVSVSGTGLNTAAGFFTTGSGLSAKIEPGTNPAERTVEITVAKDAPLGIQQIRLYDDSGLSNPKYFFVGQYPEMMEKEPNDTATTAPKVSLPITINGRIEKQTDIDAAIFHAKQGETVVCEIMALRVLGQINDSWLKGYIEIQDAGGNVLASSEGTSDDYYRWDPVIAFEPPKEGDYTVFYRDINWRGAASAVYRLTIGVVPHAVALFPLGGRRGTSVDVQFVGPNLQGAHQRIAIPADAEDKLQLAYTGSAGTTNTRPFHVSDLADVNQASANHSKEAAQTVAYPCVVNGRLTENGVRDYYRFHLEKRQKVALELFSRRVGTPMDSEIALYDPAGNLLETNDDSRGRDSRLERDLNPGDYTVMVHDIDDRGGAAFSYRLAISPPQPKFTVLALPDSLKLARGGSVNLKIHVDRLDGFDGDITVTLTGLPPGVTASPLVIPKGKQDAEITLTASGDAKTGPVKLEVIGTGKAGEKDLKVVSRTTETYNIQGTAYQRELIGPILLVTEK
jgi:hypothetical protein